MDEFQQNHIKDPFRQASDGEHYTLPVQVPLPPQQINSEQQAQAEQPENHSFGEIEEKRTFKDVVKDASYQILASLAFLAIGFVLLNWGAISKIAVHEWNKLTGAYENTPLQELAYKPDNPSNPSVESNDGIQNSGIVLASQNIPALSMEIAPNDNRIIIPDINQNVPIVGVSSASLIERDWQGLEKEMQLALQNGVVHYPGTSLPGQTGNVVITGHSSYFPWDPGRFKDVFALLHDVKIGEQIIIYYNQKKYIYVVDTINVVLPEDINVLKQTPSDQLTLITCTPVGTNLKRLIVTAVPLEDN